MSTLRIPENVKEAAVRCLPGSAFEQRSPELKAADLEFVEKMLQAALTEWGATEERGSVAHAAHGWAVPVLEGRLVTPWTPVDGGQ